MKFESGKIIQAILLVGIVLLADQSLAAKVYQRNEVTFMRGPHNNDFFRRHNKAFRIGAGIHFAHGKQHDLLEQTPLSRAKKIDEDFNAEATKMVVKPPRTEPKMEMYAPLTGKFAWPLYLAIDWTHVLHEQTYEVLSSPQIAWNEKKSWTDKTVQYYLDKVDVARSPAPLDVTMRRAGVMMKPYFTYFRTHYPMSNNFFYAAHWWHPAIYEAMMIGGQGSEQDQMVNETNNTYYSQVLKDRPQRMLLSREMMPRYSRMSPEAANAFDNLHMLHGIAYDILAFEGWSKEQKQKEIERVVKAMSYQPGDEKLARKFAVDHPGVDPRKYEEWMKGTEGPMNAIMLEMLDEMMPMMMPDATSDQKQKMREIARQKFKPGLEDGEHAGSLHDALMAHNPNMKMMQGMMDAGTNPPKMTEMMLKGWREKHGNRPDIEPYPMNKEQLRVSKRSL